MIFPQTLTLLGLIPLVFSIPTPTSPTTTNSIQSRDILPTSIPSPTITHTQNSQISLDIVDGKSTTLEGNLRRAGMDDYLWMSMIHVVEEGVKKGDESEFGGGLSKIDTKRVNAEVESTQLEKKEQASEVEVKDGMEQEKEEKTKGRTVVMNAKSNRRRRIWRRRIHP